ncbi:glycosyltransferase family 2 protein [Pectinatus brassicae]|uniref:Glycosyltransferase involved in cell wall biosynthesis n=1 Tax=Pectinatus brassicae TaxID=862415 RepID=A0A840UM19_9FIRM|nr:glycosyltransferase family 2 protein [Pectinatus brassicae]MBB5336837.1 glycosyltransferase involved in cell wall biosynthesis [Pectinatus brassicae]
MVKISACVIVKNEEENLPDWLRCMNDIADELIIVDTGSTDNTKKIAKSFSKVKLYDFTWCDDFAAAKNFALSKATGDWILFLDADEYFNKKDLGRIRENIEVLNSNNKLKIIMFNRINVDKQSNKIQGDAYIVRGIKNDSRIRYKGKVHEQLFYNDEEITDIAVIPNVMLYHTGYSETIVEDKLKRNLKIMQEDMKLNGENPRYFASMADCYYGLGEYENAIIWAHKFIDTGLVALGSEKQVYYTLLAAMQKARCSYQELEKCLLESIEKFPQDEVLQQERQALLMRKKDVFISACVIVKNEEKNIENYLKRIKSIADEIIVIDTGSTDNTIKLAKNNGVFVHSFKWINDFAAAKNFALEKAKGKWIIFLDADEYFKSECVEQLVNYIKKYDITKIEALACKFLNIDSDKDNKILNTFYQVRVFRNDKNIRYKGQIHERLYKKNNEKINIKILPEDIEVIHTGYSSAIMQKKAKRNLELLQKEIIEKGEQSHHYYYLADCYFSLSDYEKSIYYSRKFIDSGLQMIGVETNVYTRLIDSLSLANYPVEKILEAVELAIKKFSEIPDFYFMKSFFLLREKNYIEAEKYLNICFKYWHVADRREFAISIMENVREQIYLVAGILAETKGLDALAINFYIKGLEQDKYNKEVLVRLYNFFLKRPVKVVINMFNKLYLSDIKDSKFIINTLDEYYHGEVYYFYYKKINKVSKLDEAVAQKNFECVVENLKNDLVNIYKKIILKSIEAGNSDLIKTAYVILPIQYRVVLNNAYKLFKQVT